MLNQEWKTQGCRKKDKQTPAQLHRLEARLPKMEGDMNLPVLILEVFPFVGC